MANDLSAPPRSPSPLPTDSGAPTQQTPGPRATALADLYNKALTATLRSCSYENFAECFPTPAARTPRVLRAVWEQINGKIAAKGNAEFENILAERNVVPGLNALETMIAEAKGRKEAGRGKDTGVAPHELPPDDLLAAHLAPELASIQSQLQAQLTATQARNAELAAQIRGQRSEIERIVDGLEATMHDLEGANQVLEEAVESQGDDGKRLKSEVKELHAELGETDVEMKT